jgi:4-diphosphocytidyl-2C-methyl-D-erythritol kinase
MTTFSLDKMRGITAFCTGVGSRISKTQNELQGLVLFVLPSVRTLHGEAFQKSFIEAQRAELAFRCVNIPSYLRIRGSIRGANVNS